MAFAALALNGISCSALTLVLSNRRHGQPTLSSIIGLNARWQASPTRRPVSISTVTRLRVVGFAIRARLTSDSSWFITNSGMNRANWS
jgi:hypothetical protein